MNFKKRIICSLISLLMLFQIMPLCSSAASKKTTADSLIEIARSQIGSYGSDINKFTEWYYGRKESVMWCNIFVSWCADQQGILDKSIPKQSGCNLTLNWYKSKNLYHPLNSSYTPQKGDLIFFDTWQPGVAHHIGFVSEGGYIKIDGKKCIRTVEGNTSDINDEGEDYVTEKYREVDSKKYKIMGYAHPSYGDNKIQATPAKTENLKLKKASLNSISLSWSKVKEANSYYIEISTDKSKWDTLGSVSKTNATITNLKTGKAYYFRVRAYNNGGYGKYSSILKAGPAPDQVTGLKLKNITETTITVKWSKAKGAKSYKIFLKENNGSYFEYGTSNTTSYTIKNLEQKTTYSIKIKAENAYGIGKASSGVKAKTLFKQVKGLQTEKLSSTGFVLKWTAEKSIQKYIVYILNDKTGKYTSIGSTKTNEFNVTDLEPGITYSFRVRAYTGSEYCTFSDIITVQTLPEEVEGLKYYSLKTDSVKLKWYGTDGAESYMVFQNINGEGWVKVAETTACTIKISDLNEGCTYAFRVRAGNKAGNGQFSETVTVLMPNQTNQA